MNKESTRTFVLKRKEMFLTINSGTRYFISDTFILKSK